MVAWVQLVGVWLLAFLASRTPKPEQATSQMLENVGDMVALVSFVEL